jgi:hypothetical protein
MKLEDPAIPCGLVAKSYFNDTFTLYKKEADDTTTEKTINTKGIAWSSDVEFKFSNIKTSIPPSAQGFEDI